MMAVGGMSKGIGGWLSIDLVRSGCEVVRYKNEDSKAEE